MAGASGKGLCRSCLPSRLGRPARDVSQRGQKLELDRKHRVRLGNGKSEVLPGWLQAVPKPRGLCRSDGVASGNDAARPTGIRSASGRAQTRTDSRVPSGARAAGRSGGDTVPGVRGFGLRRARYVGLAKTRLQHVAIAAAMNLVRIGNWMAGVPIEPTRRSHFGQLVEFARTS